MKAIAKFLFLASITFGTVYSQVTQEWVQRFTSDSIRNENINDMYVDAAGNIYITGSQRQTTNTNIQALTVKYNSQGVQQWIQNYIAPNDNGAFARAIHVDGNGNVYVTGESDTYSGGGNKMLVIKYDAGGTQLWSYRFSYNSGYNAGFDIVTDLTGNVYVTGEYNTGLHNNISLVKFSPNGALVGQTFYNFGSEGGRRIALDGAGKIIVGGYCNINQPDSNRFVALKYEQNLDFVWATRFGSKGTGSPGLSLTDMAIDMNSHIILIGQNDMNYATFKINPDGSLGWNSFFHRDVDYPRGVVTDNLGNVYVTGETGTPGLPFTYAITTVKYNSDGNLLWSTNYKGTNNDGFSGYDIAVDNSGNVYVTGNQYSTADIATVKYNTNGTFQWAKTYNGPSNSADYSCSVGVDANGNTYTAGNSLDFPSGYDIAIIKYAPLPLFANRFSKNALNKLINDNQNTYDTISVDYTLDASYYVYDVNLTIDTVIHTNDSDLEFYLIHNGMTDTVIYQVGSTGDNFINTVLNDSASNQISSGNAPFTGSFRPNRPLAGFNNSNINGSWILKIYDRASGNTGTLRAWGLDFLIGTNPIGVHNISNEIPNNFSLSQNFPNPFNPTTHFEFRIADAGFVNIKIFDLTGKEVETLVNENLSAGVYKADWNASKYSSGVYFYRLEVSGFSETRKMILIK